MKNILTIKFISEHPYELSHIISIVASSKDEATLKLKEITKAEYCNICFIDVIDDRTYRDTIITIDSISYNAFSYWSYLYE